jgi:flagellar hook-associated protein 1 FlgK
MTKFWDAWQQLATTPESSTTRTMVVQNAEALVDAIQHNYKQLENLQINSGDVIKDQIFDVNNSLKQIADLNEQIKAVVISGKTPNDLMDRRDLLLDQLSERFGIEVTETDFSGITLDAKLSDGSTRPLVTSGTLNTSVSFLNKVYYDNDTSTWKADIYQGGKINDVKTVTIPDSEINKYVETDGTTVKAMKVHTIFYDGTSNTLDGTVNLPAQFESGSLQGYESINTDIEEYKKQLNNTARALAVSVNAIHSSEKNVKTGEYINFFDFNESDPEPAKNLKINSQLVNDVSLINAGRNYTDNGLEYENAGNGEMALLIGQLRNTRMDIQDISTVADFRTKYITATTTTTGTRTETKYALTSSKTGTTVDSYFKDSIANLGVSAQEAKKMVTNQEALLNQLDTRRESVSGVSLDEEMTNMLQFQKSYEANAKMISVIDQLLDVVVNGLIKR